MKNKYIIRSRISEKIRSILWYFCYLEATKIAEITNVSQKSIDKILKQIRMLILKECEKISKMQGKIDESCFGPMRTYSKRGRGD